MCSILIVDKGGQIKATKIKPADFLVADLYKKCGFKKSVGFDLQVVWKVKINDVLYHVHLYGKTNGKAMTENKYDFPPPVDNLLLFGSCALVATDAENVYLSLEVTTWDRIYEHLFGGFESLVATQQEDEQEEDELADVPAHKKTKVGGYLKDGFVVDGDDETEETDEYDDELTEDSYD